MMTKGKAQKRAVRARMDKTGERYTTARHYLLDLNRPDPGDTDTSPNGEPSDAVAVSSSRDEPAADRAATTAEAPSSGAEPILPPRVAEPGMSDTAVRKATGKGWDDWFALLDAWDGTTRTHLEIARFLYETYGIDGWWAQGVTVGYERARGMRALHERPDGFSMSVSKTIPVPVERLFAAFVEPDERNRWLDGIALRHRTNVPGKSARFDILPGETRLAVYITARGAEKAVAQLQQERLADAAEVARWKALWKDQLARLATYLDGVAG